MGLFLYLLASHKVLHFPLVQTLDEIFLLGTFEFFLQCIEEDPAELLDIMLLKG